MNFFDLVNISERYMELVNPSTPDKMPTLGNHLETVRTYFDKCIRSNCFTFPGAVKCILQKHFSSV